MSPGHGLPEQTIAQIVGALARFPEVRRAVLFGSRAKGTQRPGSDIDLALVGTGLDWRKLGQIDDALDDLMLPYIFSLIEFGEGTDPDVAASIQRVGQTLYEKGTVVARG